MGKCRSHAGPLDDAVWSLSREEVQLGWLEGPFTEAELLRKLGDFVPSRRFGLQQQNKVRLIDHFSESGVNSTFGCSSRPYLGGVDEIVSVVKHMVLPCSPFPHEISKDFWVLLSFLNDRSGF